jgi:uncharacterized protein HemY
MADAVRRTDDDAAVFAAFGRVFLADRKFDKARKYLQRATALAPDIGDFWGMWVACETADEKPAAAAEIVQAAKKARTVSQSSHSSVTSAVPPHMHARFVLHP